jgi:hypothetical protein
VRSRSGFALYAALALMTVLGLFIAGAIAALETAQRSARLARADALLDADADYALGALLEDPAGYALADLPLARARTFSISSTDGANTEVGVTRLPGGVLWLVAVVAHGAPDSGLRRVNVVARYPSPGVLPGSGVTARGGVTAAPTTSFRVDTASDADCRASAPADVTVAPGAPAEAGPGTITIEAPAAADSLTYFITARQLARLDSSSVVVHVRGDTTITGGAFDGILIADGAIVVDGPFTVSGLVIARDSLVLSGGASVHGAVMSYSSARPAIRLVDATIEYSRCSIARTFRHAARPRPVQRRSWAELF